MGSYRLRKGLGHIQPMSTLRSGLRLRNTVFYYILIYCTILYYTILYHTILYFTVLYSTILHSCYYFSSGSLTHSLRISCPHPVLHTPSSGLRLAGNEGMEKKMETTCTIMGFTGATTRIHSFFLANLRPVYKAGLPKTRRLGSTKHRNRMV